MTRTVVAPQSQSKTTADSGHAGKKIDSPKEKEVAIRDVDASVDGGIATIAKA